MTLVDVTIIPNMTKVSTVSFIQCILKLEECSQQIRIYGLHTSKVVFNMPHARYKVKCALCKKAFDNDNSGASLQEVPSKLHTEDSIMVRERLPSFRLLACEKDLTDLIDLEDVNMSSGNLRGGKGTMVPGQTLFVAEKGPSA